MVDRLGDHELLAAVNALCIAARRAAPIAVISFSTSANSVFSFRVTGDPRWRLPLTRDWALPASVLGPVENCQGRFCKAASLSFSRPAGLKPLAFKRFLRPAATRRGFGENSGNGSWGSASKGGLLPSWDSDPFFSERGRSLGLRSRPPADRPCSHACSGRPSAVPAVRSSILL